MKGIKFHIVENNELFRQALKLHIERKYSDCTVSESRSGFTCLNYIVDNNVDIILMDIDMPVLSGIETIQMANGIIENLKFIIVSQFKDESYIEKAKNAGAMAYVCKTDILSDLHKAIEAVLKNEKYF